MGQREYADANWLDWLRRFYIKDTLKEANDIPAAYWPQLIAAARQKMVEAGLDDVLIADFEDVLCHELDVSLSSQEIAVMGWRDEIKKRFPNWGTNRALAMWPSVRSTLYIGQATTGTVIARAPFGVWLDIGVGFPAVLLVTNIKEAGAHRIAIADYPAMSERVEGWINKVGERGEIGITQRAMDIRQSNGHEDLRS